jgi:hypothetical protein
VARFSWLRFWLRPWVAAVSVVAPARAVAAFSPSPGIAKDPILLEGAVGLSSRVPNDGPPARRRSARPLLFWPSPCRRGYGDDRGHAADSGGRDDSCEFSVDVPPAHGLVTPIRPSSRSRFDAFRASRRPGRPAECTPAAPSPSSPKNTTSCGILPAATTISRPRARFRGSGRRPLWTGWGCPVDALWTVSRFVPRSPNCRTARPSAGRPALFPPLR